MGAAGKTGREVSQIVAAADRMIRLPVSRACALTTTLCVHGESVINMHTLNIIYRV